MNIKCGVIIYVFIINLILLSAEENKLTVDEILSLIDKNLYSKSQVYTSKMIVHGRRTSRTISFKAWVVGTNKAFTKYLSPAREAGTKMLKNNDKLWTYSPQTDRTIQISGHMLRQSVMGSDMSYNDMMEEQPLMEMYEASLEGIELINDRSYHILFLEGKIKGLSYPKRRIWVDSKFMLPMKEELYAKSGKILKSISLDDIKKIQGRWFPTKFIFKDELKRNSKGTEWIIENIQFDVEIPEAQFSKALLRK
jgi:outer membrane lipoprotein-sorting protein